MLLSRIIRWATLLYDASLLDYRYLPLSAHIEGVSLNHLERSPHSKKPSLPCSFFCFLFLATKSASCAFLIFLYSFPFLCVAFFGPFRHPPLFVPVQIKIFDQSYDGEGNLKQFTSISAFHRSRCFRIATIGPIQLNPHVENFSYRDSSASPKIGLIYRWGAPISRKRGDVISLRSVAIQPPIDYVIRLEGGGA